MSDIVKAINEMFEFIKELRAEIQKQDEILEIIKKTLDASFVAVIKNEEDYNKIKEWLNEK